MGEASIVTEARSQYYQVKNFLSWVSSVGDVESQWEALKNLLLEARSVAIPYIYTKKKYGTILLQ